MSRTLHLRTAADVDRLPEALRAQVIAAKRAERDARRARDAVEGGVCALAAWRSPQYRAGRFHRELGALCDRLINYAVTYQRGQDTLTPWVCLGAPPRHGKSEHVGRTMGARAMALRPGLCVIYATSTDELAYEVSDAARALVVRLYKSGQYPHLAPARPWTTTAWATVGGCRWIGVGEGAATGGMSAHITILDDVTGSAERQRSAAWKRGAHEWLKRDIFSRDMGGSPVVLMETRRGLDDLQGWAHQEFPGRWEDHTWTTMRPDGTYLWGPDDGGAFGPSWRRDHPELADGTPMWESYHMQRPVKEGGAVILETWMAHHYAGTPQQQREGCIAVWLVIDSAGKDKERNDPSALGIIGRRGDGRLVVLHMEAERMLYPALKRRARALFTAWKCTGALIEDTSVGQALIPELQEEGVPAVGVSVGNRGDKVARMYPHLARWESGMVLLPESATWKASFVGELVSVPDAAHDDQWDVMSIVLHHSANDALAVVRPVRGVAL